MKYHERLFLSRHTAMGGVEKVFQYLTSHLPNTFQHQLKTMEDCEMLSFLRGVFQIYLEFWNSSDPLEEYVPDFTSHQCQFNKNAKTSLLKLFLS